MQVSAHHEFCGKGVVLEDYEPGLNFFCTSLKFWRNDAKDICLRQAQGKPRAWPDYNAFKVWICFSCRELQVSAHMASSPGFDHGD